MLNELVSIIVPVYNVERYLVNASKAFAGQTYRHLEIILIDDGATDNSGEICDQWKPERLSDTGHPQRERWLI